MGREPLTLDTPIENVEISVRAKNAALKGNYKTLRDLKNTADMELLRLPLMGHKSLREIREVIRYAEQDEPGLFNSEQYKGYLLEDRLTSVQSIMSDVQGRLIQVAIKGGLSLSLRMELQNKLRKAVDFIGQLPTPLED